MIFRPGCQSCIYTSKDDARSYCINCSYAFLFALLHFTKLVITVDNMHVVMVSFAIYNYNWYEYEI